MKRLVCIFFCLFLMFSMSIAEETIYYDNENKEICGVKINGIPKEQLLMMYLDCFDIFYVPFSGFSGSFSPGAHEYYNSHTGHINDPGTVIIPTGIYPAGRDIEPGQYVIRSTNPSGNPASISVYKNKEDTDAKNNEVLRFTTGGRSLS